MCLIFIVRANEEVITDLVETLNIIRNEIPS